MLTTKAEVKAEQGKIRKLQAYAPTYISDKSHFENDGNKKLFNILANVKIF